MLRALLRVGDRTIGIGFIEGRLRTLAAAIDAGAAKATRNPRAAFIIRVAMERSGPKQGGGNLAVHPRPDVAEIAGTIAENYPPGRYS
jgi:hypothetical protein